MAEIQFADGKQRVDDPIAGPLLQVTNGAPERFTFADAMKLFSRWQEKQILRDTQSRIIREHFRSWRP